MSNVKTEHAHIYVRHQSGSSAVLTFHINPNQRLLLIQALAGGGAVELPIQLELSVLQQWVQNPDEETPYVVVPIRQVGFHIDFPDQFD